jgi:uncharacterized membrane protein YhaH (DUF805 family)
MLLGLPAALFMTIAADEIAGAALGVIAALATVAFLVSTWGRRLHDRGRSAWGLLLCAVPVVGALLLLVECGLLASRPSADRYGASPDLRTDYLRV